MKDNSYLIILEAHEMALKHIEEEIEIPLYNELAFTEHDSVHRITIGFDLKNDRIARMSFNDDVEENIYLDVPTYIRGCM